MIVPNPVYMNIVVSMKLHQITELLPVLNMEPLSYFKYFFNHSGQILVRKVTCDLIAALSAPHICLMKTACGVRAIHVEFFTSNDMKSSPS